MVIHVMWRWQAPQKHYEPLAGLHNIMTEKNMMLCYWYVEHVIVEITTVKPTVTDVLQDFP